MHNDLDSAQRIALMALDLGVLQRTPHGWLVSGGFEAQVVSAAVVRWLFGERFVEPIPGVSSGPAEFRLTERGRRAALDAMAQESSIRSEAAVDARLDAIPVLLVMPAPHSEELDALLALPLDAAQVERHRRRMGTMPALLNASPDRFEFLQYADDVYAVPIGPKLAQLDLIPPADGSYLLLPMGFEDPAELGIRRCSDRGVNYGADWVQWFGGFDRESPLIIGSRLTRSVFERLLGVVENLGA